MTSSDHQDNNHQDLVPVSRALISVYDKSGVRELAAGLAGHGVQIISSGGTARELEAAGIDVTTVSEVTGQEEMIGGRVKTLHPRIHAGILALRGVHDDELARAGIVPIDLVAVNFYPFAEAIAVAGTPVQGALEQIDIGGPAMVRAAAKNFPSVTVLTDPEDYAGVLQEMASSDGMVSMATRHRLALKAFRHTSRYDLAIASYLGGVGVGGGSLRPPAEPEPEALPQRMHLTLDKRLDMRYGENPHLRAAFYRVADAGRSPLADAEQLHGKALSFNNILDLEGARLVVAEFEEPAAAVIKHSNPCGAALGADPLEAYLRALACDPLSAFGGIVAFNRPVDATLAAKLNEIFLEALIAPDFHGDALALLTRKKNLRLLRCPQAPAPGEAADRLDFRGVEGGFLAQDADTARFSEPPEWTVVTRRRPTAEEERGLRFAWRVVKHVKSNAILFAAPDRTLGVGAGQMSRVDSVKLAVLKARQPLEGSVLASDAFFPFRDGVDSAAAAGARAVVQPGGSVRDKEVIEAADEHGMAMIFTGRRHFRH
jgi:phosphoribosylaminoimidazolecarboxamide formyltransferase/IMP cyclohydrolase